MATVTRKRPITSRATATKRRRGTAANRRTSKSSGKIANFAVPLVFCLGILFCLGFLGVMGYRTVTASEFFDVKNIDVRGVNRVSKDDVQKIVSANAEKSGVWNADLSEIKARIEKSSSYIKTVAVSRVLPDGIRVNIVERMPKAAVRLDSGDVWVDDEALILGAIGKNEERPPFVMRGWDSKSEGATKDNQNRVKLYQKMLDEWKEFDLSKRVKELQLNDLDDPKAIIEDSGQAVSIDLGKENFAKRLQRGLEITAGRGKEIESVNLSGNREVLGFRGN